MAKLSEIFNIFKEQTQLNNIACTFVAPIKLNDRDFPAVLELMKVEEDSLLFSYKGKPFRVTLEEDFSLKPNINAEGANEYDYFFWIEQAGFDESKNKAFIKYLKCGRTENLNNVDIAYGDDVIFYVTQRGNKSVDVDRIPSILHDWYTFENEGNDYLFIETFPNSDTNFRIYGLRGQSDISITEGKWQLRRVTKKPFPKKYDDFAGFHVAKYKSIDFKPESEAEIAQDTIRLRELTSGDTILQLWKAYSDIEKRRYTEFKDKVGEIQFSNANQRKGGITNITLEPSEDQQKILDGELETFLNSSFSIKGTDSVISIKSYDRHTRSVTIMDDDYPIPQGRSGVLSVDVKGDEAVQKRRENAMRIFKSASTIVLMNLQYAIEGQAKGMMPKPRKLKPLSDRTRKFIKERFGIDDLTDDQKKAVDIAINTPDIAVIQGPPGTGKSTVVAVICQRLIELAEKDNPLDKVILASAFQNDTVEHIASKIETFGLPTIKVGKEAQGVRAEETFIIRMQKSIDKALQRLAPASKVNRLSRKFSKLKTLLDKEKNAEQIKQEISALVESANLDENLYSEWRKICREVKLETRDQDKAVTALKGLRTTPEAYSDDGFIRIRKALNCGLKFTPDEKEFLNDAPDSDEEIKEEFLTRLKGIQDKYLSAIFAQENTVQGGVDVSLNIWLDEAIEYCKNQEESSYEDDDTFLTATLENIREELFGNTNDIRRSIQQYGQSIAATNQFSGSREVNDLKYENVILEEAARSNPLDLLIPMVRATERIIMVGDQKQLPHLLENDIVDEAVKDDAEKKKKYQESLFGILFNNLAEATPTRRVTLTKQFRMHPVIGDFISQTYYDWQISSAMVKPESKQHHLSLPWAKDKVAVFCNVPKSKGMETRSGSSKERLSEAQRIVALLDELKTDPAFDNLSIGIITFYSKQVDLICSEASKAGYTEMDGEGNYNISPRYKRTQDGREKLRIGSVDSFQGKEFDIVILSTVRSNNFIRIDENNLKIFGFLTLENRLNVAFSRAQKLLITVGDSEMFNDEFAETYVNGLYRFNTSLSTGEYGNRI